MLHRHQLDAMRLRGTARGATQSPSPRRRLHHPIVRAHAERTAPGCWRDRDRHHAGCREDHDGWAVHGSGQMRRPAVVANETDRIAPAPHMRTAAELRSECRAGRQACRKFRRFGFLFACTHDDRLHRCDADSAARCTPHNSGSGHLRPAARPPMPMPTSIRRLIVVRQQLASELAVVVRRGKFPVGDLRPSAQDLDDRQVAIHLMPEPSRRHDHVEGRIESAIDAPLCRRDLLDCVRRGGAGVVSTHSIVAKLSSRSQRGEIARSKCRWRSTRPIEPQCRRQIASTRAGSHLVFNSCSGRISSTCGLVVSIARTPAAPPRCSGRRDTCASTHGTAA